jgi:hypothetical protein
MFKYKKDTDSWEVFNPAEAFLGYVAGRAYVNEGELDKKFLAGRLMLADFLYGGKYPLLYKRLVREWNNETLEGQTTTTEHNMLGDNVFLMEDALMQVPDIKKAIENGEWTRGELLEAMTELTYVGSTLRGRAYEALRPGFFKSVFHPIQSSRERRSLDLGTDYQPQITTEAMDLVKFVLTKTKLGRMGVHKIHIDIKTGKVVDDNTGEEVGPDELDRKLREEMEYKGERYNGAVVEAMFKMIMGVSYGKLLKKEVGGDLGGGGGGLLLVLLGSLISESLKIITKEIK